MPNLLHKFDKIELAHDVLLTSVRRGAVPYIDGRLEINPDGNTLRMVHALVGEHIADTAAVFDHAGYLLDGNRAPERRRVPALLQHYAQIPGNVQADRLAQEMAKIPPALQQHAQIIRDATILSQELEILRGDEKGTLTMRTERVSGFLHVDAGFLRTLLRDIGYQEEVNPPRWPW